MLFAAIVAIGHGGGHLIAVAEPASDYSFAYSPLDDSLVLGYQGPELNAITYTEGAATVAITRRVTPRTFLLRPSDGQ